MLLNVTYPSILSHCPLHFDLVLPFDLTIFTVTLILIIFNPGQVFCPVAMSPRKKTLEVVVTCHLIDSKNETVAPLYYS